jgi:hypothetical protein
MPTYPVLKSCFSHYRPHLHTGLQSGFLHPDFSTKTYALLFCPMRATFLAHLDLFTRISPGRNELPLRFPVALYNILMFFFGSTV